MSSDDSQKKSDLADFARLLRALEEVKSEAGKYLILDRALQANRGIERFLRWTLRDVQIIGSEDAFRVAGKVGSDLRSYPVRMMGEWFHFSPGKPKEKVAEEWAAIILRLPVDQRFAANRVLNRDLRCVSRRLILEVLQN